MKKALITGITGQDGSYLAELLLEKGYQVHGIIRRSSSFNTQRVDHISQSEHVSPENFILHYGDLTDSSNLTRLIKEIEPDEVYNLGAQSHVAVSFDSPEYTADVDAIGTLRILEAIRILGLEKKLAFIRRQLQNFTVWFRKHHKKRQPHSIRVLLTLWQNFTLTGLPSTIVKPMACTPVTEFYLTMNRLVVVKPL